MKNYQITTPGYKLDFLTHAAARALEKEKKNNRFSRSVFVILLLVFLMFYSCNVYRVLSAREVYLASSKQDAETSSNNRKDDKLIIYNGILLYKWKTDLLRHSAHYFKN